MNLLRPFFFHLGPTAVGWGCSSSPGSKSQLSFITLFPDVTRRPSCDHQDYEQRKEDNRSLYPYINMQVKIYKKEISIYKIISFFHCNVNFLSMSYSYFSLGKSYSGKVLDVLMKKESKHNLHPRQIVPLTRFKHLRQCAFSKADHMRLILLTDRCFFL